MGTMHIEPELIYSTLAAEDPSLVDLVEACVAELPHAVAELAEAAEEGDLDTVVRISHMMKGAAGSHGFMPVSQVAARLEREAQAGDLEAAARGVAELQSLIPRLRAVRVEA
jgi:HPt (histidine-containing phosphotransfer) domain-containing protein